MQGVILCAGEGTRLRPLTNDTPKPMVEVDGKPLMEHSLDYADEMGVDHLHLVVGYLKEQIINNYGDSYNGIPISYHTQESQDGLAHAVRQVDAEFDEHFLLLLSDVVYGDFPTTDLPTDKTALVTETVPIEEAHEYGVCETNKDGEITNLIEKPENPPTNQILAGSYILPPEIFNYCHSIEPSDRGEYEITDAINAFLNDTGTHAELVETDSWRVDVARPENITEVETHKATKTDELDKRIIA